METWVKKDNKYYCVYDGCNYSHVSVMGVNMHYKRVHEGKGPQKQTRKKIMKSDCNHEYVLLSRRDELQLRAINAGYVVYCKKCDILGGDV